MSINEDFIKKVRSLLTDIESMQQFKDDTLFGPFSESETDDEGEIIEWPNLTISASDVRLALEDLESEEPKP